jgi:hypothetical protein
MPILPPHLAYSEGKGTKLGEGEEWVRDYYVREGLLREGLLCSGMLREGQLRSALFMIDLCKNPLWFQN